MSDKTIPVRAVADLALLLSGENLQQRTDALVDDVAERLASLDAEGRLWTFHARDAVMAAIRETEAERKRREAEAEQRRLAIPRLKGHIDPADDSHPRLSHIAMTVAAMAAGTDDDTMIRQVMGPQIGCGPFDFTVRTESVTEHVIHRELILGLCVEGVPTRVHYIVEWPGGSSTAIIDPHRAFPSV